MNIPSSLGVNGQTITISDSATAAGLFVVKMNQQKEILWYKILKTSTTVKSHILTDDSSNVYLIGKLQKKIVFDEKNILDGPTGDIFVAKYSADGKLKWAKKYVGSSDDASLRPKIDAQGNLYIIGRYQPSFEVAGKQVLKAVGQDSEPFLLKLDRNGNYIWAKAYDKNIEVNAVSVNNKNEIFLEGNFVGNVALQTIKINAIGTKAIFYAKTDQNGQVLWAKTIGGELGGAYTIDCQNIEADNLGNAYVAGVVPDIVKFDSLQVNLKSAKGRSVFLTKIDAAKGQITWLRNFAYGDNYLDLVRIKSTAKILKLNEIGEPYLVGTVQSFLTINEQLNFLDGCCGRGINYILKYDKNGSLSFASKDDIFGETYSFAIDSKRRIYAYETETKPSSHPSPTHKILTKIELNETASCGIKINIQASANKELSVTDLLLNNQTFSYQWYKNGEFISNATQPTFQAKDNGYYALKLINNSKSSCQLISNNVGIYNKIPATTPILAVDNAIKHLYLEIPIYPATYPSRIKWYRDNILIDVPNTSNFYYSQDGTYKTRNYYDDSEAFIESNEIIVKDNLTVGIAKSDIYEDGDKCKPAPFLKAVFNGKIIQDNTTLYKLQWLLNGKEVKDSTKAHFKPITTGDYSVIVIAISENKTYTAGKYKLVIEEFPKSLPISKIENICGAKALLKVDDWFMQRFTFQNMVWRLEGKDIPNENQPFLNVNKGGNYTFLVKYKDGVSGASCDYNSFVTFEKKTDFSPNIGFSYAGNTCVVDSFKLFTDFNNTYKYQWLRDDVEIKNINKSEIFVKDKSIYKLIATNPAGCTSISEPIQLKTCESTTGNQAIILNPPKILSDKTNYYTNEKAVLSIEGCSNVNLQWLKDTKPIAGAIQKTLEIKETGNYALQIEKFGCIATTNAIKIAVENVLAVGEEQPAINIEVYPNPAAENLYISIPAQINEPIYAKMMDISGKLIENYDFLEKKNQTIDVKTLSNGIYLLVFETKEKRVVKKIIKKD